jgi:hypothetical protein
MGTSRRRRATDESTAEESTQRASRSSQRAALARPSARDAGALNLQRTAGNRAVAGLFSSGAPTVQRDGQAEGGSGRSGTTRTLTIPGITDGVRVLSFQASSNGRTPGGSGSGTGKTTITGYEVVIGDLPVIASLSRAMEAGGRLDSAVIDLGAYRIELTGVYIASVQISGTTARVSLVFDTQTTSRPKDVDSD